MVVLGQCRLVRKITGRARAAGGVGRGRFGTGAERMCGRCFGLWPAAHNPPESRLALVRKLAGHGWRTVGAGRPCAGERGGVVRELNGCAGGVSACGRQRTTRLQTDWLLSGGMRATDGVRSVRGGRVRARGGFGPGAERMRGRCFGGYDRLASDQRRRGAAGRMNVAGNLWPRDEISRIFPAKG